MSYDLISYLGKPFWETPLVAYYAARTGEEPNVENLAGKTYCNFYKAGFSLVLNPDDAGIDTIQIYNPMLGGSKYESYKDEVPYLIRFDMSRKESEAILGQPSKSGGGGRNPLDGGIVPEWVRYDRESESLHLEFGINDKGKQCIALITLMTPRRAAKLRM